MVYLRRVSLLGAALTGALTLSAAIKPSRTLIPRDIEVRFDTPGAHAHLAGTLRLPQGDGPFRVVLLIPGSGAWSRDYSRQEHADPLLALTESLIESGVAVLRLDERGTGGSTGPAYASLADYVDDVKGAVAYLRTRPEIASHAIGLIGHSQGGVVAITAAAEDPGVMFVVDMAGPAVPISQLACYQLQNVQAKAQRVDLRNPGSCRTIWSLVKAAPNLQTAWSWITPVMAASISNNNYQMSQTNPELVEQVAEIYARLLIKPSDFLLAHSDLQISPVKLRRPVLLVQGTADEKVPPNENLTAYKAFSAQSARITTVSLSDLDHEFNTRSGSRSDGHVSAMMLSTVVHWVGRQPLE